MAAELGRGVRTVVDIRSIRPFVGALAATTVACLSFAVAAGPGQAGASPAPITIAYISSLTGEASAQYANSQVGFEARLALQNAEGGVHGHKLVPLVIDDQTSPSEIATAVQEADSKAFSIVSNSPLFFLAAKYPQQQGIPVTGSYDDGPEWGTQPYTNMFASDAGSVDPKYPVSSLYGTFMKSKGATNLGTFGYGISPTSTRAAIGAADSMKHAGGKAGLVDTSIPFGSVNFTSIALTAKQDGINAIIPTMDGNSNYALQEALEQTGDRPKVSLFATGYEPSVINSPAWSALQGTYWISIYRPWSIPNAGTEQMQSAMEKYAHFSKSQFPTPAQYEAWAGADLMVKGLELAGSNPTHAAVIKDLRGLKSYNVNGLLPNPINYSTIFGHDAAKQCFWVLEADKSGFRPTSSQPLCGSDIPGTSTANAS
jgi:ABC-type branched-subunit amino acid transport system substrate-binding protein